MRIGAVFFAAALATAPLGAQAADLVVWWEQGFNPEEDAAIAEVAGAFEQETGKQVELTLVPQDELPSKVQAALDGGRPPDLAFGNLLGAPAIRWAHEGHLVDLAATVAPVAAMFDPVSLERWTLTNEQTGQRALHGLPAGRTGNNLHAWQSLLEAAGFTLDDIPGEWEQFWAFWCDLVQPAVRKSLGRENIWGIGQSMSAAATADTEILFRQFADASERFIPPLPTLMNQPFWLDPSDQRRIMAVMQLSERGLDQDYVAASGDWRHAKVSEEHVRAKAIHRVGADGISPERAVDEAIARIKQILRE